MIIIIIIIIIIIFIIIILLLFSTALFCLKNEQECIIRFKNLMRRGEFLHLIIQDCEFFKRLRKSKSLILIQTAKQSVFSSKSVKKSVKRGVRVLCARTARASVFSLVPHLLFDCSLVLEYAKIRTVLQSNFDQAI